MRVSVWLVRVVVAWIALLVLSSGAVAQVTDRAGIDGKITDDTGAVLPGVTVSASSPALQMPQVSVVSDTDGRYRLGGLPGGIYTVVYELAGFQRVQRRDLRVGVGVIVTLDVKLAIGALAESVTVSGQSPVVDVRTTSVATNVTAETLETLPTSRTVQDVLKLVPGVRLTGQMDVGGSNLGTRFAVANYGSAASGQWMTLDGLYTYDTFQYYDMGALEEVQIHSVGNDAEVPVAGVNFTAVLKSGGNNFHGSGMYQFQNRNLQSDNLDDELRAQGVTQGNGIDSYFDSNLDLGGRVVPDRLWFYTGGHLQQLKTTILGYSGLYPQTLSNYTVKLTGQATTKHRVSSYYHYNSKHTPNSGASRFRQPETTADYKLPSHTYKTEWTFTPTSRSLIDVLVGRSYWLSTYEPRSDQPSGLDTVTQIWSGAAVNGSGNDAVPSGSDSDSRQIKATYSYSRPDFLKADHEFKVGLEYQYGSYTKYQPLRADGRGGAGNDFRLYFNGGTPFQVDLFNTPYTSLNRVDQQGLFVTDNVRIGDRLTMSLGLRWDRYDAFLPEQTKPAGPFSVENRYPKVDIYDWRNPAPRLGLSYALGSQNRSVVKATFGRFNFYRNSSANRLLNYNDYTAARYNWIDGNGDRTFNSGELGTFVSTQGGNSRVINPELEQPRTYEATLHVEHELVRGILTRVGYVYKRDTSLFQEVTPNRGPEAHTIPVVRTDPGPDGRAGSSDDGGPITVYVYPTSFVGPAFDRVMNVNTPANRNTYHNVEFVAEKRFSRNWGLLFYYLATKNDAWIGGTPQTPSILYPKDQTWDRQITVSGSYAAPFGIRVAGTFEHRQGAAYARQVLFNTGLPQLNQVTLLVEPTGSRRLPSANLLNARLEKQFTVPGGQLSLQADLYNALNVNTATGIVNRAGATYGYPTGIVPPRIGRFGVTFKF